MTPLRKGLSLVTVVAACMIWAQVAAAAPAPLTAGQVLGGIGSGTINQFTPTGTLLGTLSTGLFNSYDTGMCFDAAGNLIGTNFTNSATKWDATGNVVAPNPFLSGGSSLESCAVDASGNFYTGDASANAFYKFDSSGALVQTFSGVTTEDRGTDWLDLSKDQVTMLYTSEGDSIFSYNVGTSTQGPVFATGLAGPCYALRIRPNGEVMVACASTVYRLSATGTVIQMYNPDPNNDLFALNLDPDGTSFWTADLGSGAIYRVDIASGAVLTSFVSNVNTQFAGLAVVGELRAALDTTPPLCALTATLTGPPKEIQVTVQDTGTGIASIAPTSVNATVTVPVFAPGSTSAQVVTADKTDQGQGASLSLTVTDVAGNKTVCDPVFGLSRAKTARSGGPIAGVVHFTHLQQSASRVTLQGGTAGIRAVDLFVNGTLFHVTRASLAHLTKLDIGSAMRPGAKNVVVAKVHGKQGATVNIVISD